eukprot:7376419-Prymnesium_polylepis.3
MAAEVLDNGGLRLPYDTQVAASRAQLRDTARRGPKASPASANWSSQSLITNHSSLDYGRDPVRVRCMAVHKDKRETVPRFPDPTQATLGLTHSPPVEGARSEREHVRVRIRLHRQHATEDQDGPAQDRCDEHPHNTFLEGRIAVSVGPAGPQPHKSEDDADD